MRIGDETIEFDAESLNNRELRDLRDALNMQSVTMLFTALGEFEEVSGNRDLSDKQRAIEADKKLRAHGLDLFDVLAGLLWIQRRRTNPGLEFDDVVFTMADIQGDPPEAPVGKAKRTGTARSTKRGSPRSRTTSG
jgi:hypothetical protein